MSDRMYVSPVDEQARLEALADFGLLDTPPEKEFDRLTHLAARLFRVPIVLISLVDQERQFFKSHLGLEICETGRDVSFCAHAIQSDDMLLVPDAALDPRFADNALVLGAPFIRFYAGMPLVTPQGYRLGTICLIDTVPRARFNADDHKNLADLAALVMDRMELRRLDVARTIGQRRFENIAATSPDAIMCSNALDQITYWNHAAEKLFGYSAEEVRTQPARTIVPENWRPIYEAEMARLRAGQRMQMAGNTIVLLGRHKDGSEFPAEYSLSTWEEGDVAGVGAIVRDITERRQNEARLFRLASMDALTELHNRAAWQAKLEATVQSGLPASVLMLDLDLFKEVNDTLGHSAGDAVLREVAARLNEIFASAIMVARLGGDEFVALIAGNDVARACGLAGALVECIAEPFWFGGERIDIGTSVGIALAPEHGTSGEELLVAADLALYSAKAAGKQRFVVYDPALRQAAVAKRNFEQELRRAHAEEAFEVYYQPQYSICNGEVIGAEALLRWNHPTRGLLQPGEFLSALGPSPLALQVGRRTMLSACAQAAQWRQQLPGFRIGVNLFESQFRSPTLAQTVAHCLEQTGLPAQALELEILETVLLRDDKSTLKVLQDLRAQGVGLAFDDYGTGFASLSLLKRYPVTRLKIDQTFLHNVTQDQQNAALVKAIIYLGKSFGLEVIAEGVETAEQLAFLRQSDCLQAQGYYFGEAVPAAEFTTRFIQRKPTVL